MANGRRRGNSETDRVRYGHLIYNRLARGHRGMRERQRHIAGRWRRPGRGRQGTGPGFHLARMKPLRDGKGPRAGPGGGQGRPHRLQGSQYCQGRRDGRQVRRAGNPDRHRSRSRGCNCRRVRGSSAGERIGNGLERGHLPVGSSPAETPGFSSSWHLASLTDSQIPGGRGETGRDRLRGAFLFAFEAADAVR
jgi:hypothetical protein